jgi:hypothetical protein
MKSQKLVSVDVRGDRKRWGVNFYASQGQIDAMRADGLEIWEVENVIPGWVVASGLTSPSCILQDLWNFKNPWRG